MVAEVEREGCSVAEGMAQAERAKGVEEVVAQERAWDVGMEAEVWVVAEVEV